MGSLFVFVVRTTRLFIRALAELLGFGPSISPPHVLRATPGSGWPGTVVTLDGTGFDATLDGNVVEIGGAPTLVMAATAARLTVLVGENATSGAIRVTARGITTTAPQAFEIRAWPDSRDSGASGPPVFFHGPQAGTPALGKKDMRVLVVFASAVGSPAVNIANETAAEMATFASADRFWREATYGRTSFRFEAGPWVHLPLARNAYVFDDRDVEWARDALLTLTKRHTHIDGQRGYCAHQGGGLAVVDLAGSNWPSEVARLAPGWIAHHVVVRGGTAFVAAGKDGLIVVNVAGSLPVQIAKVTLGGNLRGCDVSGNLLVAAAGDGGVEFYDVSNPAAPVRHTVFATGVEWATAVKLVGTRAYVGAGKGIRVYDVSNFFVPHLTGSAALGDWAMGLDVAGNTCVVATDGGGLAVFDVSGPSPSPRGNNKDALNLFNVHLAGGLAYAAAGADGVLVVDVANPSSPTLVKLWPTGNACYDVAIGPGFGVAALGASGVAPVSLADPRQPLLGIQNYLTSTPPLGGDPNLGTLRTNLKNAANSRGKSKGSALMVHALLEAMRVTPGLDPNAFEGFVVVLQGAPGRGASGLTNGASFEGRSLAFSERKGFVWLASHTGANRTTWGRKAHEMGHWFGMPDIYTEWFEDGTFLAGDAENWDMAGDHDRGPLFSGRQADRMALFNPANVARRVWNPAAGPTNETFDIVAHDAVEDASGRIHLLELKVSAGLSYYVEVRQRPATAIFDANIPVPPRRAGARPGHAGLRGNLAVQHVRASHDAVRSARPWRLRGGRGALAAHRGGGRASAKPARVPGHRPLERRAPARPRRKVRSADHPLERGDLGDAGHLDQQLAQRQRRRARLRIARTRGRDPTGPERRQALGEAPEHHLCAHHQQRRAGGIQRLRHGVCHDTTRDRRQRQLADDPERDGAVDRGELGGDRPVRLDADGGHAHLRIGCGHAAGRRDRAPEQPRPGERGQLRQPRGLLT
jgi:hypothetical protein